MGQTAIPDQLDELTSIRFFAAAMVLFVHIPGALDGHPAVPDVLVVLGHRGVDLFFLLSGFIMMHAYGRGAASLHFGAFFRNRLARVYPLHLFVCLIFVLIFARPGPIAFPVPAERIEWADLPWHLLGLHSLGMLDTHTWNFPSWSVSAELLTYSTFPLALVLARRAPLWAALGVPILSYVAAERLVALRGADLYYLTYNGGLLRALLGFWLGVGLYRLFLAWRPPTALAGVLALGCAGATFAAAAAGWDGLPLVLLLSPVIWLCASMGCNPRRNVMRSRALVWLGERSYAFYLAHVLVIQMVYYAFHVAGLDWFNWTSVAACMGTTVLVANLLYRGIELPARQRFRTGGSGQRWGGGSRLRVFGVAD